ncbi:MAG: tetratricopeptide repeat protein, partial [Myxococcales bacterium]|nr:tetratricopeptide repeat protein [Myxococcales bacterium]
MLVAVVLSALPALAEEGDAIRALIDRGVRANFSGRWDDADAAWSALRARDPAHPAGHAFQMTTAFWRIALDAGDPRFDGRIQEAGERAVALSDARCDRNDEDAEAHFFAGQALGYLARLDAERGRFYDAGSLGERGRRRLERALELRPGYEDPKFALGSYYYFSDLVPSVLKYLRWLWFIPSGDAERGLRYLEAVRASGDLNRLGATYTLFRIYALFESDRRDRALALGRALRREFPDNAVIQLDFARLLMETGRVDEARHLLDAAADKAARGVPSYDAAARVFTDLWRARANLFAGEPAAAEAVLA